MRMSQVTVSQPWLRVVVIATVAIGSLVLVGCTQDTITPTPTPTRSPSSSPSPTQSPTSTGQPPSNEAPGASPEGWSDELLHDTCVAFWIERVASGESPDSEFVPGEPDEIEAIFADDGVWDVLVPGTAETEPVGIVDAVIGCTISGTPEAPVAGVGRGL